jgi:hypothetical protein
MFMQRVLKFFLYYDVGNGENMVYLGIKKHSYVTINEKTRWSKKEGT